MMNLISSAPSHADLNVVDAAAGGGVSPMAARSGDPASKAGMAGRTVGGKRLFGEMLTSALGSPGGSRVAGSAGNRLPVPALQEREVGAGMRLITAGGADRPGEDALFAFAVSQGLDASLVASVLWPGFFAASGPGGQFAGLITEGESGYLAGEVALAQIPPAEVLALLAAGASPGQTPAAIGGAPVEGEHLAGAYGPFSATDALAAIAGVSLAGSGAAADGRIGLGMLGSAAVGGFGAEGAALSGDFVAEFASLSGVLGASGGVLSEEALAAAAASGGGALAGTQAGSDAAVDFSMSVAANLTAQLSGTGLPRADSSAAFFAAPGGASAVASSGLASQAAAAPVMNMVANGLVDLKIQIKAAAENALAAVGGSGGLAGSVPANVPAHWVLMGGASPGGGLQRGNSTGPALAESALDELAEIGGGQDLDGAGGAVSEVGHRHHSAKGGATATDAIDLTAEAQRQVDGSGPDADEGLARRFAEGVSQRMLASIASNSWKLQIDLKPAHLGHVSIEMSMQQGQLEAVFDAGQASTRHLISDGLERLRQDLQRAGMNVAHLGLNFGGGAGTGGKSTPRGNDEQSTDSSGAPVQELAPVITGSRSRVGADGLDVTV